VPVSVIRRDQDDGANTNKLDATRQALREQIEARERAEHLLQEAQATIHDLQTKLAHERFARDEAIQRVDGDRQVVEQALLRVQEELAIERDQRQKVVQERDETAVALRPRSVQEVMVTQDARKASQAAPRHRPAPDVAVLVSEPTKTMPTTEPSAGGHEVKLTRRRGRPAKSDQSEAEIVEWWKPGWRNRIR
jgi:hypothetical protein